MIRNVILNFNQTAYRAGVSESSKEMKNIEDARRPSKEAVSGEAEKYFFLRKECMNVK